MYRIFILFLIYSVITSCDNRTPQEIAKDKLQKKLEEIKRHSDSVGHNVDSLLRVIRN